MIVQENAVDSYNSDGSGKTNLSVLTVQGVTKTFPGVRALSDVSIDLRAGEVHALIGENGAGKSTLIKILSGDQAPDEGKITFAGNVVNFSSPADARSIGVATIFQELMIVPDLTVAENVMLGNEPTIGPGNQFYTYRGAKARAAEMLHGLGMDIDPGMPVSRLTMAQKQIVEIARALLLQAPVIIMDEPTAALSDGEAEVLLQIIEQLRDQGTAVLFVSHRLDEVRRVADQITVLRGGKCIDTFAAASVDDTNQLIKLMIGKELSTLFPQRNTEIGETVFSVRDLTKKGFFEDINFDVKSGEILGIAGLAGAGRTSVMRSIFGVEPFDGGEITKDGERIHISHPDEAILNGIAYLPEERKDQGLVLPLTGRENIAMASLPKFSFFGLLKRKDVHDATTEIADKLVVKGRLDVPVRNLSGGNQQKIVIGKWLMTQASVYIFNEPTKGIDIGAKAEIYSLMHSLARQGAAVIMVSSELPELLNVAHRILVMSGGRIQDELSASEFDEQRILKAAFAAHISLSAGAQGAEAVSQ